MAQVKTIKQEEKCLTSPHPNAYTEAEERKREQREGGKKRRDKEKNTRDFGRETTLNVVMEKQN